MKKTTAYTDSRWSGKHFLRTYEGTNGKGERIEAEFTICENPHTTHSLPRLWHENGYTDRELETWWSVAVYCYDENGVCRAKYNPTAKKGGAGYVLDFDWVLEATPENLGKLSDEITRRAFAA